MHDIDDAEDEYARASAIDERAAALAQDADLGWVTAVLTVQRDLVLEQWLDRASVQPFHAGHREHAVADHIPHLLDALIEYLRRGAGSQVDPGSPFEDEAVYSAARAHAQFRLEQGLEAVDVVIEFRLLRHEILGALRRELPDGVPTGDVIAAELLINDALDGAISVGLVALTHLIETVREDFLATTIHDVRQPLTLIKGAAQLARRTLQRAPSNLDLVIGELERIDAESTRMAAMLGELIDASRIALQQLDLRPERVDLAELLSVVVSRLGPDVADRVVIGDGLEFDATGQWDRERLERVIRNLLSNAVKYSPAASSIEVTIGGAGGMVEFSIRDYGIGVAAEELPRLFERYRRARGAVDRGIEGVGLGLYLTRGIVQAHGGRIWADSAGPGSGTTFHVILPRVIDDGEEP
ncbi:MAG: ATP-binding protein [Dehalococcoidia bacterium]